MRPWALLAFLTFSFLTVSVSAQSPARDDRGFYSRLTVGVGGSKLASEPGSATLGGVGAVYDLALGYRLFERLALHITYFGARAFSPVLKVNGKESKPEEGAESSLNGVGLGVTYSRSGAFLSSSLGLGIIEGVDPAPAKRDVLNAGFAAGLTVGYEWRLSESFGLGLAASAYYFYAKDKDGPIDLTWQGFAAGPALSLSYERI